MQSFIENFSLKVTKFSFIKCCGKVQNLDFENGKSEFHGTLFLVFWLNISNNHAVFWGKF